MKLRVLACALHYLKFFQYRRHLQNHILIVSYLFVPGQQTRLTLFF